MAALVGNEPQILARDMILLSFVARLEIKCHHFQSVIYIASFVRLVVFYYAHFPFKEVLVPDPFATFSTSLLHFLVTQVTWYSEFIPERSKWIFCGHCLHTVLPIPDLNRVHLAGLEEIQWLLRKQEIRFQLISKCRSV